MFEPSSFGGSARPGAAATSSVMTIPGTWQDPRIYLMSATAGKSPLSYHDVTDFLSHDTIEEEVVTGTLSRRRLLQGHYQGGGCYRDTIEEEVVTGTLSRRRLLQGHYQGGGCYRDTIKEEVVTGTLSKRRLLQGHYQGGGCYRDTIKEEVVTGTLSRRRLLQGCTRVNKSS